MGAALPSPSSSILPFTLLLSLLVLLSHVPCSTSFKPQVVLRASGVGGQDQPQPSAASAAGGNKTGVDHKAKCLIEVVCKPGVLLPVWLPLNPPMGEQAGRAIIYFACLLYMFLGVSIIADRFMGSIEVITSQEKEVKITQPNGEVTVTTVRIWNETVSNLTLMALGSSAPEILLSVIEVIGHNFHAGELGPGTIVGSAAFNMFVIIGLCVWVIPNGETRKIKHLRVFIITAFWSIFAYIWLYLILAVISPEVVEVWEAIVTLVYFPVCVLLAWIADRRLLFYKYTHKRYRADKRHGIVVEMEGDHTSSKGVDGVMDGKCSDSNNACAGNSTDDQANPDKDEVVRILKDQKEKHPDADLDQLIEMANYSALVHQKKSRAFYRVQATRLMIGAGNVLRKHAAARRAAANSDKANEDDMATCSHISFEKVQYQCTENCGTLTLAVVCLGGTGENTFYVDYRTENGSANAGADYELVEGTLVFKPGEVQKEIKVSIVDDDVFEEDEHFFVRLQNLRLDEAGKDTGTGSPPVGRLVDPVQTTVTILDDDHAGIFTFRQKLMRVSESTGVMVVTVARNSGSRGVVTVPYHTEDGTARAGLDYDESRGELEFSNEQTSQTLQVRVINVAEYEKQENFFVVLEDPKWLKRGISGNPTPEEEDARRISEMGKPILGEHSRLEVVILESYEFKSTVDTLLKDANLGSVIGSNSWKEQFIEAVTVSAGGDDEEGQEQRKPNCGDYLLHIISVFWKILFAFVPPTSICNGWACFVVSICVIGFLTAIIGDLASHFGCTVGLRDTVTAVVFVALGTSIPDTFASKVAATQDDTADASVGNVTGSNAVNVFLGIGVAWSVAAVYWEIKGEVFRVDPGSLAFSVTLFTIFAFIVIFVLMFRRKKSIGGELGGPKVARVLTTLFFVGLWFLYILFSSLEAYCHVQGF